jgi:YVTN family beta-propeller protein
VKSIALAALLLLTALASGQVLERTISLCDTFGWLKGEQSFAYDSRRQLAYVCGSDDSMLFVLDGKTNAKKARIPVPSGITGIVYDSTDDRLFCARGEADSVVVLDCRALSVVAAIPVGDGPVSISYADRVNKAYTANEGDQTISVLDCGTMTELARLPAPLDCSELLYNRVTNTLWFIEDDSLYVIGCAADSIVAQMGGVWQLDCDQATGTMYCIASEEDVMVIDGADFQILGRIEPEFDIWSLVCAWQRGLLYMVGDGGIEVYDYRVGEVVDTIACYSGQDLASVRYSPEADVVWLAWSGCWCGSGHVAVVDCATNGVLQGPGVYDRPPTDRPTSAVTTNPCSS